MISNIKDALVSSFTEIDGQAKLTNSESVALKNILAVAKERIWLADPTSAMEYNDYHGELFSTELDIETIERIKSSIKLMDAYLLNDSTKK